MLLVFGRFEFFCLAIILDYLCVNQNAYVPLSNTAVYTKDEEESKKKQYSDVAQDNNIQRDEWVAMAKDRGELGGVTETIVEKIVQTGSEEESVSPETYPHIQPGSLQQLEGMDDSSIR